MMPRNLLISGNVAFFHECHLAREAVLKAAIPGHFVVRYVSAHGGIRWHHQWVNISHTPALVNMSASRQPTMASGLSPSAHSHAGDCLNTICTSKMLMVDSHDTGACDPCLWTFLVPISPRGQSESIGEQRLSICLGRYFNISIRLFSLVGSVDILRISSHAENNRR